MLVGLGNEVANSIYILMMTTHLCALMILCVRASQTLFLTSKAAAEEAGLMKNWFSRYT